MFGIGGRAFTSAIERELDVSYPKAESIKVGLSAGKVVPAQTKKVDNALNKTLDVWINGVELALAEFEKLDHLPHRLLLCGGGSSLQMLMDRLEEADWYESLPFTKKPAIQHIRPDEVVGITDSTGDITDHTYITAMGLLRVGLDTLNSGTGSADNGIKERLNKVLRI